MNRGSCKLNLECEFRYSESKSNGVVIGSTKSFVNYICTGCTMDRRRLLLIPAVGISMGSFQYTFEKGAAKAEFADSESFINIAPFEKIVRFF